MKTTLLLLSITLLSFNLTACKNTSTHTAEVINIYNKEGKLINTVSNSQTVSSIKHTIDNRQITNVKILPLYTGSIEISIDDKKQYWLISSRGYIKRQDNYSQQIYKINNPEVFFKFFS